MRISERIVEIVYEELGKLTLEAAAEGGLRGECEERIAAEIDRYVSSLTLALTVAKPGADAFAE